MPTHETNIHIGRPYRDSATGFEGAATSLHIYTDNIQRVTLSTLDKNGVVAESTFDAGRLEPTTTAITGNGALGFTAGA